MCCGQRELDEDAVDRRVRVQPGDLALQLLLRDVRGRSSRSERMPTSAQAFCLPPT